MHEKTQGKDEIVEITQLDCIEDGNKKIKVSPFGNPQTQTQKRVRLTAIDSLFAIAIFIIGYQYIRWLMLFITEESVHQIVIISVIYLLVLIGYVKSKGIGLTNESYFWIGIYLLISGNFLFIALTSLALLQTVFHIAITLYMTVSVGGGLINSTTSNFVWLDLLEMYVIMPLKHLLLVARAALAGIFTPLLKAKEESNTRKHLSAVLLGTVLSIPILLFIVPKLVTADSSGSFTKFVTSLDNWVKAFFSEAFVEHFMIFSIRFIFSLPVVVLLGNNLLGHILHPVDKAAKRTRNRALGNQLRILPDTTVWTVLAIITVCYGIFITTQIPYFFSAFFGRLPIGEMYYSEYARTGFFELCTIVVFHFFLLLVCNLMSKTPRYEQSLLRLGNSILAVITLFLVATAISKMFLYISIYGLTSLRILVCAFLLFLVISWIAVLMLQYREFVIMRPILFAGVIILTIIFLMQVEEFVAWYNAVNGFTVRFIR